jgi:hypothetical protein
MPRRYCVKNGPTGNDGSVRHEVARDEWTH